MENDFIFYDEFIKSFSVIKEKHVTSLVIVAPNWDLPFEMIWHASDYAVGAVLGQRHDKFFHDINYVIKVLNDNQVNCVSKVLNDNQVKYSRVTCRSIFFGNISGVSNWDQSCYFYRSCSIEIHVQRRF